MTRKPGATTSDGVLSTLRRDERPGRVYPGRVPCVRPSLWLSTRVQLPRDELRSALPGGGSASFGLPPPSGSTGATRTYELQQQRNTRPPCDGCRNFR
jgi:hypothetical protein